MYFYVYVYCEVLIIGEKKKRGCEGMNARAIDKSTNY